MKKKRVGCPKCKATHLLDERVKPEHYSGGEWSSVCPMCGHDGYISVNQLNRHLKEVAA